MVRVVPAIVEKRAVSEANHAGVTSHTQAVAFLVKGYGGCCIPAASGAGSGA
jgi:hypothetical protein